MNSNNPTEAPAVQLQPGLSEHTLFVYGYSLGTVQLSRKAAEKAAQQKIGQLFILPGQCLRILSCRMEDDTPDGQKGRVIAICERLQDVPYRPSGMEYK